MPVRPESIVHITKSASPRVAQEVQESNTLEPREANEAFQNLPSVCRVPTRVITIHLKPHARNLESKKPASFQIPINGISGTLGIATFQSDDLCFGQFPKTRRDLYQCPLSRVGPLKRPDQSAWRM